MTVQENLVARYDSSMSFNQATHAGLRWYSPKHAPFHVAGLAWFEQEGKYRRLPTEPSEVLPEAVDYVANCPSGGQIRFRSDSPVLTVRVKLAGRADLSHMPATAQCGIDCYIETEDGLRYCNTTKYDVHLTEYECTLFTGWGVEMRNIVLFMPLYQGVEEIEIGLLESASILPPPAYVSDQKVIVYGTSITQGGCASRPGMMYTNILSRRIPLEFLNLGFSGNGKGEPEVAKVIATIPNPACLIVDYEGNCVSTELFRQTLPEFVRIYREAHPTAKILVVARVPYARENFPAHRHLYQYRMDRKAIEMELVNELRAKGDENIFFYDGAAQYSKHEFNEFTVDGSHATDLGFLRMADGLEPVLKELLL